MRFILFAAGLILAALVGKPWLVLDAFQRTLGRGDVIGPICSAMGYAFVLKATGADKDMVRLLTQPIRHIRWLLVPGGCAIGFCTNMAITSQTASAAAVGPILIPLMIASGYSPLAAAATLLVGCSIGGNLFNPGEPDIVAIRSAVNVDIGGVVNMAVLPNILSFVVAVAALVLVIRRGGHSGSSVLTDADTSDAPMTQRELIRALLPPLPILLLLLLQPGLGLVPPLLELYPQGVHVSSVMVLCTAIVMLSTLADPRQAAKHLTRLTTDFFEGMGYAFTKVISLILAAACFLAGLDAIGAIQKITALLAYDGTVATLLSPTLTWGLAVVSGSGTAPSVAFSQAVLPGIVLANGTSMAITLGVLGAIGASIGRTMSPVSAITLFTSTLAAVDPKDLVKLVSLPLIAALLCTILYGLVVQ